MASWYREQCKRLEIKKTRSSTTTLPTTNIVSQSGNPSAHTSKISSASKQSRNRKAPKLASAAVYYNSVSGRDKYAASPKKRSHRTGTANHTEVSAWYGRVAHRQQCTEPGYERESVPVLCRRQWAQSGRIGMLSEGRFNVSYHADTRTGLLSGR